MKFTQKNLAEFILDHRYAILFLVIALSLFFGFQLRHFKISHSIRSALPEDDPDIVYFDKFRKQFGDTELIMVGIQARDIFTYEVLTHIKKLTDLFKDMQHVQQVISLSNVVQFSGQNQNLTLTPFLKEIPTSAVELADKKRQALANKQWIKNIISADGKAASINILIPSLTYTDDRLKCVKEIRAILETHELEGVNCYLAGMSPIMCDTIDYIRRDFRRFMWLTPVLMALMLGLAFKTFRGLAIPLTVMMTSVVWTLGLFFWAGKSISMATTIMPVLVGVICLSDVIHIINRYYEAASVCNDKREVLVTTMENMVEACFLTSITTAVGFASLGFADIKPIREFGIWSAYGIMIAYVLGISLVPIILSFLDMPDRPTRDRYARSLVNMALHGIERLAAKDKIWMPLITVGLGIISIIGITKLSIESQISAELQKDAPSIRSMTFIEKNISGFRTLELAIEGRPGTFKEAWALKEIQKIQNYLDALPDVDKSLSLADFIGTFHRAMNGNQTEMGGIPDDSSTLADYLMLISMSDRSEMLNSFVTEDFAAARISARIHDKSTRQHLQMLTALEDFGRQHLDPRLKMRTTGALRLYATKTTALIKSQIRSLGFSFLVITLILIVYLRSIKTALIVMIPNMLPVIITLGVMGFSDITLNLSTVMIASIAIAITVDDTIHFLARYRSEVISGVPFLEAVKQTLRRSGQAMVFTSFVIAGGFFILVFSNVTLNRHFGLLTAFTMITALMADLFLLPYLIKSLRLR